MMQRLLLFLIIAVVLLSSFGCAGKNIEEPTAFYYLQKEFVYDASDGVIASEMHDATHISNIQQLLNAYLEGPTDQALASPFPDGIQFINVENSNDGMIITVSNELGTISGIKLTLACCCLAKTVMDYSDVDTVLIQADSVLLDGDATIVIRKDTMALLDTITQDTQITDSTQ